MRSNRTAVPRYPTVEALVCLSSHLQSWATTCACHKAVSFQHCTYLAFIIPANTNFFTLRFAGRITILDLFRTNRKLGFYMILPTLFYITQHYLKLGFYHHYFSSVVLTPSGFCWPNTLWLLSAVISSRHQSTRCSDVW